jgi:hypothetical protein
MNNLIYLLQLNMPTTNLPLSDPEPKLAPDMQMPCNHSMNGRNLIVCIDGTSNQFGKKVSMSLSDRTSS